MKNQENVSQSRKQQSVEDSDVGLLDNDFKLAIKSIIKKIKGKMVIINERWALSAKK